MMKELLREALSSCEKDLEELHSLIPESDPGLLADLAHRIKGRRALLPSIRSLRRVTSLKPSARRLLSIRWTSIAVH